MFSRVSRPVLIVSVALIFLVILAVLLQVSAQTFQFPDSATYVQAARSLYIAASPDPSRPALFSLLVGLPMLFGMADAVVVWSVLLNLVAWLGTILLTYKIARRYVSAKRAMILAIVLAACPGSAILVFHILTETIFTFVLILVVYLLIRFYETKEFRFAAFAVGLTIASVLIKPGALWMAVLGLIGLIVFCRRNLKNIALLAIVIPLIAVGLYGCQMKREFGDFTISYIGPFTYYNYLGARAEALNRGTEYHQGEGDRYNQFARLSSSEQKSVASADLQHQIKNNSANLVKAYFINLFDNATGGSSALDVCQNKWNVPFFKPVKFTLKAVAKIHNILFSLMGIGLSLWILLKKRKHLPALASALIVLGTVALSVISSSQGDRFSVVLYPIILCMIAMSTNRRAL